MPHEFRTIEQFVQLLEKRRDEYDRDAEGGCSAYDRGHFHGHSAAYEYVLQILRTSNIGIVYPPQPKVDHPWKGRATDYACETCGLGPERHGK